MLRFGYQVFSEFSAFFAVKFFHFGSIRAIRSLKLLLRLFATRPRVGLVCNFKNFVANFVGSIDSPPPPVQCTLARRRTPLRETSHPSVYSRGKGYRTASRSFVSTKLPTKFATKIGPPPGGGLVDNLSVKRWALSVPNFYLSAVAVFAEEELSTFNS